MESYALLVPLVILVPAIGTFINFFWGAKMGERAAGYVAVTAAVLTFIFSVLMVTYLTASHGLEKVVDPIPLFDGWIRIGADSFAVEIPWQFRVDALTGIMLLVVTGVGSLIHIYSVGYIHGDPKAPRFFAFLNLFLVFMLILVTGNNYLMMFVGWEGVGLCSYLLIGFWWDKKGAEGWKNADAARKAMILNRIGDLGILMAAFLIFWTFGTLDYAKAGETINPEYQLVAQGFEEAADHGEADADHSEATTDEHGETVATDEHATETTADETHTEETTAETTAEDTHAEETTTTDDHGETTDEHAADDGHGGLVREDIDNSQFYPNQMGVFGQATAWMKIEEGGEILWGYDAEGHEIMRTRDVNFGPFTVDIQTMIALIIVFILLGATGKSAQIPLFVWLPDAMAGPTPVSALIHAATMVTAGVYLLVRSSVLLEFVPEMRFIVALVGGSTALMGGFVAMGQWDIKRVLAYSTISQLGFMVAAVGVGAYTAAVFHLATHAVFKALLFLGSGSVIHGMEHGHHHVHDHGHDGDEHAAEDHHDDFDPQDMRNMGGLRGKMPITFITYLFGTLALAGIPIFAGFWSKDEILAHAYEAGINDSVVINNLGGLLVLGLLIVAAAFTAFYMWRQMEMVFFGTPRSEAAEHAPESTAWMTVPLMILGFGAIVVGFIMNWPFKTLSNIFGSHGLTNFLGAAIPSVGYHEAVPFNWGLAIAATAIAVGAIIASRNTYGNNKSVVPSDTDPLGVDPLYANPATRQIWKLANARLYWDEFYAMLFLRPYERLGNFFANTLDWDFWHNYMHDSVIFKGYNAIADLLKNPIDLGLIDGIVNGVGKVVNVLSGRTRTIQTGYVRTYAVALLFGVVAVVVLMLLPLLLNGS